MSKEPIGSSRSEVPSAEREVACDGASWRRPDRSARPGRTWRPSRTGGRDGFAPCGASQRPVIRLFVGFPFSPTSQAVAKRGRWPSASSSARGPHPGAGPKAPSAGAQPSSKRRAVVPASQRPPICVLTVREGGALSDLDNITVRIADVAARLTILVQRFSEKRRSPTLP